MSPVEADEEENARVDRSECGDENKISGDDEKKLCNDDPGWADEGEVEAVPVARVAFAEDGIRRDAGDDHGEADDEEHGQPEDDLCGKRGEVAPRYAAARVGVRDDPGADEEQCQEDTQRGAGAGGDNEFAFEKGDSGREGVAEIVFPGDGSHVIDLACGRF